MGMVFACLVGYFKQKSRILQLAHFNILCLGSQCLNHSQEVNLFISYK